MRVIVAAAGTGGHINPGIAIANKIKEKEPDSEIIFIGTNRGIENDLVPRAGYGLKTIEAYGFKKELSINNLKQIWQTFRSKNEAEKIIDEFKPDVVIGTGGYICVPVMRAAIAKKIPIVLHESNAYPGKAIKKKKKNADLVLVGFEDTKSKRLLIDTYFLNLSNFVNYIDNKQVDKTEYILGIRDTLLSSQGARDMTPDLNLVELVKFAESKKINAAYYLNALLNKRIQTEQEAKELALTIRQTELDWRNGR